MQKAPDNTTYEYGREKLRQDEFAERAWRSKSVPSGQTAIACNARAGSVREEMHGGVWEWTDSSWQRRTHGDLGVLRGGRCARR